MHISYIIHEGSGRACTTQHRDTAYKARGKTGKWMRGELQATAAWPSTHKHPQAPTAPSDTHRHPQTRIHPHEGRGHDTDACWLRRVYRIAPSPATRPTLPWVSSCLQPLARSAAHSLQCQSRASGRPQSASTWLGSGPGRPARRRSRPRSEHARVRTAIGLLHSQQAEQLTTLPAPLQHWAAIIAQDCHP